MFAIPPIAYRRDVLAAYSIQLRKLTRLSGFKAETRAVPFGSIDFTDVSDLLICQLASDIILSTLFRARVLLICLEYQFRRIFSELGLLPTSPGADVADGSTVHSILFSKSLTNTVGNTLACATAIPRAVELDVAYLLLSQKSKPVVLSSPTCIRPEKAVRGLQEI
jgi:hypothetical protein